MRRFPVPCIPWETLRDAYLARFGEPSCVDSILDTGVTPPRPGEPGSPYLEDGSPNPAFEPILTDEQAAAAELAYHELKFTAPDDPDGRIASATFGAAQFTGGHELFLVESFSYPYFGDILTELIELHAPLSPGQLVPMTLRASPFVSVLLLPKGTGSLPLGVTGGEERFALQVVPLTRAEHRLATASLSNLVDLLRAAGALTEIDPFRDCVVQPWATREIWRRFLPALRKEAQWKRRWRQRHLKRVTLQGAPDVIIDPGRELVRQSDLFLARLRACAARLRAAEKEHTAMLRRVESNMKAAMAPVVTMARTGTLPGPLFKPCGEILGLTLFLHPVAQRVLRAQEGRPSRRFDNASLPAAAVDVILKLRPLADRETLLSAARTGLELAEGGRTTDDGVVRPHVAWTSVCRTLCLTACDTAPPGTLRIALHMAVLAGIETANQALLAEEAAPPLDLLERTSRLIAREMAKTWLDLQGMDATFLEDDPSSSPAPRVSPKKTPRKPPTVH